MSRSTFPHVLQAMRELGPGVWHVAQIAEKADLVTTQVSSTLHNHETGVKAGRTERLIERVGSGLYRLTFPGPGSSPTKTESARSKPIKKVEPNRPAPVDTMFEKVGNVKGGILVRGDVTERMYVARELEA